MSTSPQSEHQVRLGATDPHHLPKSNMSDTDHYAVGWICALPSEYDAAQLVLDSIYDTAQDVRPDDANDYIRGRIGAHDIVLAKLATEGIASTDDAAKRMVQTFADIRFILLVGLGVGVHTKEQGINLGDVVVGSALAQYTVGYPYSDQNSANRALASCQIHTNLAGFEPKFGREHIKETISSIERKVSVMRHMLNQPDLTSQKVKFPADLTVHHGLVASINQTAHNDLLLHDIEKDNGILCFTDRLPWLPDDIHCAVVRGISEHAGGDENDGWRRFAAMAAASYAKKIILSQNIPPRVPSPLQHAKTAINSLHFELDGILSPQKIKFEHVQKPRRFFRVGRVFVMIWTEPSLDRRGKQPEPLKGEAFSEIRRFIVVQQSYRASLCIPIQTYNGQGVHKRDIRIQDHAKIYRFGDEPPVVTKNVPLRDPIGIVIEESGDTKRLHSASVVNFGKIYTVEHGAKVMNIGYVHKSQSKRLEINWKTPNSIGSNMANMHADENETCSTYVDRNPIELGNDTKGAPEIKIYNHMDISQSPILFDSEEVNNLVQRQDATSLRSGFSSINEGLAESTRIYPPNSCKEQGRIESNSYLAIEESMTLGGNTHLIAEENSLEKNRKRSFESNRDFGEEDIGARSNNTGFDNQDKQHDHETRHLNWACPFFRLDPAQYLACGLPKLKRFSDVIQHLKRSHTGPRKEYHCPKCFSEFGKQNSLNDHISKCFENSSREFFYHHEFEDLRTDLRLSRHELEARLGGHIPAHLSKCEFKWFYIWQTHFSKDFIPESFFVDDIVTEVAELLRRQNESALQEIVSNGQSDFRKISHTAYKSSIPARRYWLHHPYDPNSLASDANNFSTPNAGDYSTNDNSLYRDIAQDDTFLSKAQGLSGRDSKESSYSVGGHSSPTFSMNERNRKWPNNSARLNSVVESTK